MNLCHNCSESMDCFETKIKSECDKFKPYDDDLEVLELYHGMTSTMQVAIKEIMKVTQAK